MEEYYKWRIEQLEATVAKQEEIIRMLVNESAEKTGEIMGIKALPQ